MYLAERYRNALLESVDESYGIHIVTLDTLYGHRGGWKPYACEKDQEGVGSFHPVVLELFPVLATLQDLNDILA
jgi:hypothetical protein